MSGAQQFGLISGGLFGGGGAVPGIKSFFSDRRLKEDIVKIDELENGTPVYQFRYWDSPEIHIGLMADDVEKFAPDAVSEGFFGFKMVDYNIALGA